jgi:predicted enzyme related to lactoylglutathione lyase
MSERNPVGWFELYVQDIKRAKAFYEKVLGVSLTPLGSVLNKDSSAL